MGQKEVIKMGDIAIITSKYVINNDTEILNVYRDLDGDWQFLGNEDLQEEDAKVISLAQILEIDSTISSILNLDAGYCAKRKFLGDKWIIKKDD